MAEKKETGGKLDDPKTLEGVVVESVGDVKGDGTFTTVVAVPEAPPPPINPDDAIKAACERAAGGTREPGSGREGHGDETSPSKEWLSKLAEADARLSAAAAASDATVKRRIGSSATSSTT